MIELIFKMGDLPKTVNVICPDYSTLLEEGIRRHLSEKELTDVVFNCDGNEIHAHRLMISIFVPDLMNKLENSSELANLNLNGDSLPSIIEFIYSGKVEVPTKQLTKLKKDAEMLEFELMVDTIDFLQTSMNLKNKRKVVSRKKNSKSKTAKKMKSENNANKLNNSNGAVTCTDSLTSENEIVGAVSKSDTDCGAEQQLLAKKTRPILNHERLTFIRCSECEFETPSESLYLRHLNDDHELDVKKDQIKITYRCYKCDFTTEDRVKWHTHRTIESRRGNFNCTECDKVFHYKILLDRHIQYNHSTDRPYHCDECEYKGTTYGLLKDHKKVHKKGNFKCSSCDMTFKLKSYLVRHTMHMHSTDEERTFLCHICPKRYVRLCDLNKHIRDFHCIQPPVASQVSKSSNNFTVPESCHHCNFKTKHCKKLWVYHLAAKHQEDVDGNRLEPNIKCDQCDRTFCIDSQLYNHKMTTHGVFRHQSSEEKPYMCETCGHRTKFKHQLAIHRKTHSGDRFTCEMCHKIFKSKLNLKRHIGFMHNPNAKCHVCHICSFATKRKSLLREHISRMHKNRIDEPLDKLIVEIL